MSIGVVAKEHAQAAFGIGRSHVHSRSDHRVVAENRESRNYAYWWQYGTVRILTGKNVLQGYGGCSVIVVIAENSRLRQSTLYPPFHVRARGCQIVLFNAN